MPKLIPASLFLVFVLTACVAFAGSAKAVVLGIDVSHWQGSINWNSVQNSGREFAFIKATQGTTYTDPRFFTNMSGSENAGVLTGVYHFATPYTDGVNDAIAEADWFVQRAGNYMGSGYLPPVLDLETEASLGLRALSTWAKTFIDRVEELTDTRPIIYTSANYASNYVSAAIVQAELWIAHWGTSNPNTGSWNDYLFHQYSATESIPGISGDVDGNRFPGTLSQLQAMTNPVVIPEPTLLMAFASLFAMRRRRAV